MSRHHRHGEESTKINLKLYFRILNFTWKYWFRLTVGIFFGMLVGGSLLFALMMVPQMVSVVENPLAGHKKETVVQEGGKISTGDQARLPLRTPHRIKIGGTILYAGVVELVDSVDLGSSA